ncbi:MAG TPA: histidinol-phosphatase [Gammaproteobacteria bacterium]|jgi:myo-inositol-1(or 4)-monophosphatase
MAESAEMDDYLYFAIETMARAGDISLRYFRTELEVENKAKKRKYDPVTRADREVESYLRERIRERFPGHAIVGEEYGNTQGSSTLSWLIDPIDGTRGFLCGTPMWGILLGLMDGERCVAGFVRQPFLDETYAGCDGKGFVLEGGGTRLPLRTRSTRTVEDAIVCCTHPNMFRTGDERRTFAAVESACRFTRYGTDCYGYCLLARGFVDLVVEGDLEAYDIVPLIPIVEAAGGVVTDWKGNPAIRGGAVIAAANPALHEAALRMIAAAG